ncbi:enhancer of polycomb-like-domain-containing protein [Plectosphaerella plurivora]|uniref:Enhancer of polycomb-like protein n=1 Tax=Plectosphaerella plurivora TaxID=936078 RepID=A0A9P9A7Y2_9PEZI|nr:enhancer of polycomb-like-domain-containing protein [Plectosphaerella plurivora]
MSTRKVRVKKLSVKTPLPILREGDIDKSDFEALTTESQISTGVEAAEETEYHLQSILKEAGTSNDQEIPVPPPQESDINYDQLYPASYEEPRSYIRFSQTVEECISVSYDMSTEDDEYLKKYNSGKKPAAQLSENDFERIMEVFEVTATEQAPFAAVDNTVVPFEQMVQDLNTLGPAKLMNHAKQVYEYWKARRQEAGNKPIHPTLKFETHQETDDADPFVCFRRREARQTRKTRQRDVQSAEKLKRLRKELEDGRQLIINSYERESLKRELLTMERMVFEQRQKLKEWKRKLNIKGDDDELVNQKVRDPCRQRPLSPTYDADPEKKAPKKKAPEAPALQRPPGAGLRIAVRSDGRTMDADLAQLADKLLEKENELRADVEAKVQTHRKWNHGHIDLTRGPLSPVKEQGSDLSFRPAKTQYLMTPPASSASDSELMDVDEEVPTQVVQQRRDLPVFQFSAGGGKEKPSSKQPAFRRRIGRLNRLWIDRRGLASPPRDIDDSSDRWKYDQDDDDEPPVYDVDPFDTRALKFRATIPLSPFFFRPRQMAPEAIANGHTAPAAPPGGRPALPPGLQQQQQVQQQPQQSSPPPPAPAQPTVAT